MRKVLLRTHAAVEDCEKHLTASNAFGTEIESFLTQYLLVILCSDVQQEMYKLSEERAAVASDGGVSAFVSSAARRILRSVCKGDIAKYVAMFGNDCKDKLNSQLSDAEVTVYNNAVDDRHDVAHKNGALISFGELKNAVLVAEKLLRAAAYALDLASPAVAASEASPAEHLP